MARIVRRTSILVMDANPLAAGQLRDQLQNYYQIYLASSGTTALEILHNNQIDLVLADDAAPGMSALELFRIAQEQQIDTAKVLLTHHREDGPGLLSLVNQGTVDEYITRPFDQERLLKVVHEVLDARLQKLLATHYDVEKQLVQYAKMATLGELVASILHEINNPLSFIRANLKNLLKFCERLVELIDGFEQSALPEKTRAELVARKTAMNYDYLRNRITEMIHSSLGGTDRMKKIIQEYKSFSRMSDSGFAEADIHAAIDSTLELLYHQFRERIEIKKSYGSIPLMCCSIAKLSQVFMNLLVNAIQAIEGPGEIEIATGMESGMAKITIRDSGCGMSEEVLERIFDPFFTTKPEGVGTGLGLSIIKTIIGQHHGQVSVQSTPGIGTTFTLKLPVDLKPKNRE